MDLSLIPWKELGLLLVGGILAACGFFLQRMIRRDHVTESLDRRSKTLDLHQRLRKENLTIEDVDRLEDRLASRRRRTFDLENATALELSELDDGPRPGMAQQEMNKSAAADLDVAKAELKRVCLQLSFHLDENEASAFGAAQKAWEKFSDAEARLAASPFEGGSMQAGILFAAKTELVVRRIAEIKSKIEDWEVGPDNI